jgi:Glycosyl hydrolase family 47
VELGHALYPCFVGVTKVPCNRINMKRGTPSFIEISTAETGSIQLEFRDLSRSANITKYEVSRFPKGNFTTEVENTAECCFK